MLPVGSTTRVRHFETRSACGNRSTLASITFARSLVAGLSSFDEPLQLVRAEERAGLRDPREPGVDRRRRLADARQDLAGERARVRERGVEAVERAVRAHERRPEAADRQPQVRRLRRRRRHRPVEVRDEVRELRLVAAQALGRPVQAPDQPREVARLRAGQRGGDLGRAAQRGAARSGSSRSATPPRSGRGPTDRRRCRARAAACT